MRKRFKTMLRLSVIWPIVLVLLAAGIVIADQSKVVLVGGGQAYKPLDDFVLESESPTVAGDNWYVDSGKTASGDGKSWDYAVITVNEAVDLCTASSGDVIHAAPGHAETIDSATDLILDVIGIKIIGYGDGSQRPTFTWATAAAATIPVSAADVVLKNMIFDGTSTSSDGPTAMFTITGAGFQFIGNEVIVSDSTEQAVVVITGSADADDMKVIGNRFYGTTDAGNDSIIAFTGAADNIEIAYNTFETESAEGTIDTISVITQVNIHHNYIWNTSAADYAIHFDGNATGTIAYNQLVTDVFASALDPGYCDVFETYWGGDAAHDVLGTEIFTHEDGNVLWSATELVVMEAQANDALVDEGLDYLVKVAAGGSTTAYPSDVTDYSILGYVMAIDGAVADYDEATDSLEAISDKITTGADTLSGIGVDHFLLTAAGGSTTAYPSDVTDYSILGYIMAQDGTVADYDEDTDSLEAIGNQLLGIDHFITATAGGSATAYPSDVTQYSQLGYVLGIDGDASGYDEATDSLEALGDQVDDTNLELMANNALVDESLDHFVKVAAGGSTTAYPSDVTAYSQLGYILGIDGDSTGFDEATDSLEALGDQVDDTNLELMANNALVDEGLDHMITVASGGTATAYPENVTASSVIAYIMAIDGAITDYDEATDSLEALGDQVTDVNLELMANNALVDEDLDTFLKVAAGGSTTAYPSDVTDYSVLAYIMAVDGAVSDYDEGTDSLEALGTDTDAIIVVTEDIQDMVARCVTRASDTLPQGAIETIFDVNTGPVRILDLIGEVTTVIGGTATNLSININPTTGAASDMATNLAIANHLDGSFMTLAGAFGSILINTATAGEEGVLTPYLVPMGIITITTDANVGGEIAWFIRYEPMTPGATITANP